jgi:hypothetical protein
MKRQRSVAKRWHKDSLRSHSNGREDELFERFQCFDGRNRTYSAAPIAGVRRALIWTQMGARLCSGQEDGPGATFLLTPGVWRKFSGHLLQLKPREHQQLLALWRNTKAHRSAGPPCDGTNRASASFHSMELIWFSLSARMKSGNGMKPTASRYLGALPPSSDTAQSKN